MTDENSFERVPAEVLRDVVSAYADSLKSIEARGTPAGLLYHYCDAAALLNIFQNRQLWATDTGYLNDATELVSLFGEVERSLSPARTDTERFVRDIMVMVAKHASGFRANLIGLASYVTCFSEDGDVLSQWRAYAANGTGFAIGFDPHDLQILAPTGGGTLKRMSYGGPDQDEVLLDYFRKVVRALAPLKGDFARYGSDRAGLADWLRLRVGEFLHEVAFECKHPAFHEEREWRIIGGGGDLKFRAANNRLVPYKLLDVSSISEPGRMPIREIVIGPCADKFESERVLTYLADQMGYGHAGIGFRASSAPYRA